MNIIKKLLNNKLNLTIISLLLLLLFILFNICLLNRPHYNNIEAYTNCSPSTDESLLKCPGLDSPVILTGKCADTYSSDTDEYRRCVDIDPASSITPPSGAAQEIAQNFCSRVTKQKHAYNNYMANYCPQDK